VPWSGGELLHWGPWKIYPDSLRIWASLSTGTPIVPSGSWCLGGGEDPIPGTLKDGWRAPLQVSKTRKWASISIGVPLLGNMDERFFLGAFLLEEFLLGPLEICTCPVDEYLSP